MTPQVIVVANIAGGTGKTTTAHAIATACAEYGKRALVIDGDPSATLTFACGIENPRITGKEFFSGDFDLATAAIKSPERFALLPASSRLASLESLNLSTLMSQFSDYEIVIVDTASNPSIVTSSFLKIADLVLMPFSDSFSSLRGAIHIRDFCRTENSSARIELVEVNSRPIDFAIRDQIKADFQINEVTIREDIKAAEAITTGKSVLTYAPDSDVASDYRELTYVILDQFSLI